MHLDRVESLAFSIGDYVAGGLTGAATGAAVNLIVGPGQDLVLAMLLGMAIGTIVHLVVGLVLSPVIGFFHVMVPGGLIGMYGGMLFAMRDVMQATSRGRAAAVGALFGLIVTGLVQLYDRAITTTAAGEAASERTTWTSVSRPSGTAPAGHMTS